VIWAIDRGIDERSPVLQTALEDFAARVTALGLDVHVVLVAPTDYFAGTVLGGDASRYRFVPDAMIERSDPIHAGERTSPLFAATDHAADYADLLRAEASTHVVVVQELDFGEPTGELGGFGGIERALQRRVRVHAVGSEGRGPITTPFPGTCDATAGADPAFELFDLAEESGGVRVSICASDWRSVTDALMADLRDATPPCENPNHPLFRIASRTGGRCTTIAWDQAPPLPSLPPVPRLNIGLEAIDRVEIAREGDTPIVASIDATGAFAVDVPGIVPGPNSLVATAVTVDDVRAQDDTVVYGQGDFNSAPLAMDDSILLAPSGVGFVFVLANDADPNGDVLRVVSASTATDGLVSCDPGGTCRYEATPSFGGGDAFTYTVSDGRGGRASATVRVNPNRPPIAPVHRAHVRTGETVSIDMLAGASDPEGGLVRLLSTTPPERGRLLCDFPRGTCAYTADPIFAGTIVFAYTLADERSAKAAGLVYVQITRPAPLLAPSIRRDGAFQVGATGTYVIGAANEGTASAGPFSIEVGLANGLGLGSAAGDGWSCTGSAPALSCAYAGPPIPPGAATPDLRLETVVGRDAFPSAFSGVAIGSNITTDTGPVVAADLAIVKAHDGDFTVGELARYRIVVTNVGNGPPIGAVTVTDELPVGLTLMDYAAPGWACVVSSTALQCVSDATLAAGSSAPAIELTVLPDPAAVPGVVNMVAVATPHDILASNDVASDPTAVRPGVGNAPPDCSRTGATPSVLWPPNHHFVAITPTGMVDPDGDPLVITVTGVHQDEAVIAPSSGHHSPDAIIDGSTVRVRAEREGRGDGRVYHIEVRATDPTGESCSGTVTVCVPHDRGARPACVDGGPLHSST
jgi:uncharacterized repeat protein (TIGR01451 family)